MGVELANNNSVYDELDDLNVVRYVRDALASVQYFFFQIFGMSMWNYGPHVLDALIDLITSLAVSSEKYLDSCLEMLVSNFMPPYYFLDKLTMPRGLAQKYEVLSRVHTALQKISDLVPLVPLRLLPIIAQRMPTIHKKDNLIVIYVENMLRLESSTIGEIVGSVILEAVVERLRDLDVEIGWDDILQEDSGKGIFDMELEDVNDAADDNQDGDEFPSGSLSRKSLGGNVIAELLDSLMVLTLEHLESCQAAGRLIEIFETLLRSFEKYVMSTYKSKFSQFILFYACALDPEKCGVRYATKLADIFVCSSNPSMTRMSAVAYLASYLSRGKFLSASFIVTMLKRLVDWCLEYCKTREYDSNPRMHQVFYSACQAIMYVLCFRMRSIMDIPRLKSQLSILPLELILKHKLNPLKVCLPSVVDEFLRQAKAAINSFIRPNFIYWSMVRSSNEVDEEDNSVDNSDDEVAEVFVNENGDNFMEEMGRSFDEQDLDLDYALNKMSITPNNSFKSRFGVQSQEIMRMPSRIRPSMSPESL
ncbi:RNA polymerase I-specific transcription initiation factor RRN3 [Carica papaya]|uniref:RNA polymerase I-specific transcription initiation factor RRN3 n=1 Tax=Carica papaya TaxID=3649 RepID=UPI000B8CF0F5|nr:RNA polymerase I-specific transcription initiation factor RRN3 [Carica papaya]